MDRQEVAGILAEEERKHKLQEQFIHLSKETMEMKDRIGTSSGRLSQSNEELLDLRKECTELEVKASTAEMVKDKLANALRDASQKRRDKEKTLDRLYDEIERCTNSCFKKYCFLAPKLTDSVEPTLGEDRRRKEVVENAERRARIEAMLFFNNVQVKVLNQLQDRKEVDELLTILKSEPQSM